VDLEKLAKHTENYTGADIAAVCNEAVMLAIREYVSEGRDASSKDGVSNAKVKMKHFEEALKKVEPMPASELENFKNMLQRFRKMRTAPAREVKRREEPVEYV